MRPTTRLFAALTAGSCPHGDIVAPESPETAQWGPASGRKASTQALAAGSGA
jgi:hypothetical protein